VRTDLREVKEVLREQGHRLGRIETGLAGLRRDQADDAAGVAEMGQRLDRLAEKVDRIERRLDLSD
jgi:hypothetical protein